MEKDSVFIAVSEKAALKDLEQVMKREGYEVTATTSGPNALKLLEGRRFDVVLAGLRTEKVNGMDVLEKVKSIYPDSEVILMAAHATVACAVEAMKKGAYHYASKPFKLEEIREHVRQALLKVRLRRENLTLRQHLEQFGGKVKIITRDPAMYRLLETAKQIAPTDCNIVLSGESGTGKELLARYIHYQSARADRDFFAINCAAFTEEQLSAELFGHEKVDFTGASVVKKGLIELASGGTLFMDEVTGM
jgi:DNA-binding NtrC family response regulator